MMYVSIKHAIKQIDRLYLLFSDAHRLLQTDFFLLSSHFISFLF